MSEGPSFKPCNLFSLSWWLQVKDPEHYLYILVFLCYECESESFWWGCNCCSFCGFDLVYVETSLNRVVADSFLRFLFTLDTVGGGWKLAGFVDYCLCWLLYDWLSSWLGLWLLLSCPWSVKSTGRPEIQDHISYGSWYWFLEGNSKSTSGLKKEIGYQVDASWTKIIH